MNEEFFLNQSEKILKENIQITQKQLKEKKNAKHIQKELNCIHNLKLLSYGTNPAY